LPVFAVFLCRKFATEAVFSWHLPHLSGAAALRELRKLSGNEGPETERLSQV
jgi:hypothetical protein